MANENIKVAVFKTEAGAVEALEAARLHYAYRTHAQFEALHSEAWGGWIVRSWDSRDGRPGRLGCEVTLLNIAGHLTK